MDSLQEGIRAASSFPKHRRGPTSRPGPPTARDIMTQSLVTLSPRQSMAEAIVLLSKHKVSGAPVLDSGGELVGILSELDCMKLVASGAFHQEELAFGGTVAELMTPEVYTIEPTMDLYAICHRFMTQRVRRLPVLENGKLVGIVSRRDVLLALRRLV